MEEFTQDLMQKQGMSETEVTIMASSLVFFYNLVRYVTSLLSTSLDVISGVLIPLTT